MVEKKWNDKKDTPLPKLLHTIFLRGDEAGALNITRGMLKRRIYFQKGWPVNASSNSMSDVLGRVMFEEGIISEEAYEKSLEIVLKQKKKHGEVLISMGLVSQKQLDDCLTLQLHKKIWRIFNWPDGSYNYFLVKGGLPSNIHLLPINPASLIIKGILQEYCPFDQIEALLKKFMDKHVTLSPRNPYKIEDLGLNLQEIRFIEKFDGNGKTNDIINNAEFNRRKAELLTYGLLITDIITSKDRPAVGVTGPTLQIEPEYTGAGYKPESDEGEYGAEKKADAELIFQNGKLYLTKKDYEKAVTAFEETVRLNPDEAEYKAYLGWAIFNKHPHLSANVKNLLMEALSINPDLESAHLFLAKLHIREGLLKEAEGNLATALRKTPFLPEARKELTLIKMRSEHDIEKKGYVDYFNLTKNPFVLLPDPDQLYLGDSHSEALYFLLDNLNNKSTVILLTGEKGSGKTSLCLKIMEKLEAEKIVFVYINSQNIQATPLQESTKKGDFDNDGASDSDVLIAIKNELELKIATNSPESVISALREYTFMCREANGRIVVILDNADKLSSNSLRAVSTLLDIGIDNLVLTGEPNLKNMLNNSNFKQIKKKISGMHRLHQMNLDETIEYISERIAISGGEGKLKFTPWAFKVIHNTSFGNPELINKICDISLDMAMKNFAQTIDEQIVKAAASNIDIELDEILTKIEPLEDKTIGITEETANKIISRQITAAMESIVKKEIAKITPKFGTTSVVNEVVDEVTKLVIEETANKIVMEQIPSAVEDAVKKEINMRMSKIDSSSIVNEVMEKVTILVNEESTRKIVSEQIPLAVEEAVKRAMKISMPQIDSSSIVDEIMTKVTNLVNEQALNMVENAVRSELNKRASQPDIHEETKEVAEKADSSALPPIKASIAALSDNIKESFEKDELSTKTDTSFVSFEAFEKKNSFFSKNSLLIIILILASLSVAILFILPKLDILREIISLSNLYVQAPAKKVEPKSSPSANIVLPNVVPDTEQKAVEPSTEEKAIKTEDKKVLPETATKPALQSSDENKPMPKDTSGISSPYSEHGTLSSTPVDKTVQTKARLLTLTFEIIGSGKKSVPNGGTFKVKKGDKIKIVSADAGKLPSRDVVVNMLGFVGDKNTNSGEDRGYVIDTTKDMWINYSIDGKGIKYPIMVKYKGENIGNVILELTD